jgi:glycosyltransferase involved in cell wall biosynthesis
VDGARNQPLFSIVVATLNVRATVEPCIKSIRRQSTAHWELLIADGGSTDGTLEVLERERECIAWLESRRDRGIYDAWNRALPHCRGRYVMFLGADDQLAGPDVLEGLESAIGNGDPDLVTSHGLLVRDGNTVGERIGKAYDWRRMGRRMVVCHPALLHARRLFATHGSFDPTLRIVGDLEFLLRLPRETTAVHVDQVSVVVRDGGVSRRRVLARLREQRTVLARHPRFGPLLAWWIWLDRLWRVPVAKVLRINY